MYQLSFSAYMSTPWNHLSFVAKWCCHNITMGMSPWTYRLQKSSSVAVSIKFHGHAYHQILENRRDLYFNRPNQTWWNRHVHTTIIIVWCMSWHAMLMCVIASSTNSLAYLKSSFEQDRYLRTIWVVHATCYLHQQFRVFRKVQIL